MPVKRPLISVAPFFLALWRRKSSSTCATTAAPRSTQVHVTLRSRSRKSDLAAHHADELIVLQGLANLHLHNRHDTKAPQQPLAHLRGCPSPLHACQASLFVGEIMVILRTSAEPGLRGRTRNFLRTPGVWGSHHCYFEVHQTRGMKEGGGEWQGQGKGQGGGGAYS